MSDVLENESRRAFLRNAGGVALSPFAGSSWMTALSEVVGDTSFAESIVSQFAIVDKHNYFEALQHWARDVAYAKEVSDYKKDHGINLWDEAQTQGGTYGGLAQLVISFEESYPPLKDIPPEKRQAAVEAILKIEKNYIQSSVSSPDVIPFGDEELDAFAENPSQEKCVLISTFLEDYDRFSNLLCNGEHGVRNTELDDLKVEALEALLGSQKALAGTPSYLDDTVEKQIGLSVTSEEPLELEGAPQVESLTSSLPMLPLSLGSEVVSEELESDAEPEQPQSKVGTENAALEEPFCGPPKPEHLRT